MKPSVWVRMDTWLRHLIPVGVTLLLLLLNVVPVRLPGYASVAPMLPLMAVFYWAVYRPDLLPAWMAFVLGVLADILAGTPLGVNALILLLTRGVATTQRRFLLARSFMVAWLAFALLAAGANCLAWLLVAIIRQSVDPGPALVQFLLTLGVFPLLIWVLSRTQAAFLKDV